MGEDSKLENGRELRLEAGGLRRESEEEILSRKSGQPATPSKSSAFRSSTSSLRSPDGSLQPTAYSLKSQASSLQPAASSLQPPASSLQSPASSLQSPDSKDWITAPATPPGHGAIAIVRLDGPGCWEAARKVWTPNPRPSHPCDPSDRSDPSDPSDSFCQSPPPPPPPRCLTLGEIREPGGTNQPASLADQALVVWFPAPHSYTGNDLVEFHCHGSPAVVQAVFEALVAAGARLARPGEFTERAFLNGRLDLAQAEGVANLIAARTREASRAALAQIQGTLSREVLAIRENLLDLAAEIEARLDFPEEEIAPADRERLLNVFRESGNRLERLIATSRRGRLLRDGARVVIAGKPNAGKSSLFNELTGMERAIVTPHPGTTRDSLEATLDIRGIPLVLVDTAGVRRRQSHPKPEDIPAAIEDLGIQRTLREVENADLVLLVVDGSAQPDAEDLAVSQAIQDRPHLLIANKADLPPAQDETTLARFFPRAARVLRVSALRPAGMDLLEEAIAARILGRQPSPALEGAAESVLVTNLRHAECLRTASDALARARVSLENAESGELTMVDLYQALDSLGDIVGLTVDDAVLSRIFSRFCIGK